MEMLEGRAAARQQNGKLEEALTDGNRMLKVEKSNPRVTPNNKWNETDARDIYAWDVYWRLKRNLNPL